MKTREKLVSLGKVSLKVLAYLALTLSTSLLAATWCYSWIMFLVEGSWPTTISVEQVLAQLMFVFFSYIFFIAIQIRDDEWPMKK